MWVVCVYFCSVVRYNHRNFASTLRCFYPTLLLPTLLLLLLPVFDKCPACVCVYGVHQAPMTRGGILTLGAWASPCTVQARCASCVCRTRTGARAFTHGCISRNPHAPFDDISTVFDKCSVFNKKCLICKNFYIYRLFFVYLYKPKKKQL